jgi:hypothetical protein
MPAHDDHQLAPHRRDKSGAESPRKESALDVALREVMAENAAAHKAAMAGRTPPPRAAEAGATPDTVVNEAENDTTPSELDLTGSTPTVALSPGRAATPGPVASAPGASRARPAAPAGAAARATSAAPARVPGSGAPAGRAPILPTPARSVATTPAPAGRAPVASTPPPAGRAPVASTPPPAGRAPVASTPPPAGRAPVASTPPPAGARPLHAAAPVTTPAPAARAATSATPAASAVAFRAPAATPAPAARTPAVTTASAPRGPFTPGPGRATPAPTTASAPRGPFTPGPGRATPAPTATRAPITPAPVTSAPVTPPPTAAGPSTPPPETTPPPAAGEAGDDADRNETMVLEALLLQIPGVDPLALYKLTAAGLNRFASLGRCSAEDIARHTGVSVETAQAIAAEVARWKGGLASPPAPGEAQADTWQSLEPLLAELEASHANLERATAGWTREQLTDKRRLRQERDRVYTSIKAALATVGEVDLLLRLEKHAFAHRIEELHRLLRAGAAAGVLTSGNPTKKAPFGEAPNGRTHP